MCVCGCLCVCVGGEVCVCGGGVVHGSVWVCVWVCMYMCVYVSVCLYVCVRGGVYKYVYIYIYICKLNCIRGHCGAHSFEHRCLFSISEIFCFNGHLQVATLDTDASVSEARALHGSVEVDYSYKLK